MRPAHPMSSGLHLPLHYWRSNWHRTSKLLTRYCPARYILRSSSLPLCSLHRSSICHPGRIYTLIPPIHGLHPPPDMSKSTLRSDIHRSKSNLLPSTFPRPSRHATTIFRLPRCLYTMKHYIIHRLTNLYNSRNHTNIYHLRSIFIKTKSPSTRTNRH